MSQGFGLQSLDRIETLSLLADLAETGLECAWLRGLCSEIETIEKDPLLDVTGLRGLCSEIETIEKDPLLDVTGKEKESLLVC